MTLVRRGLLGLTSGHPLSRLGRTGEGPGRGVGTIPRVGGGTKGPHNFQRFYRFTGRRL